MNCREVLAKVYEYLDLELSQDENKQVKQHLEFCSHCLKKYQIEEEFNNILKQKSKDQHDVSRLKARISDEIKKIDSQSGPRNISFLLFPLVAAIAIAVVAFMYSGNSSQQRVYEVVKPFADEHGKCIQNLLDGMTKSEDPAVIRDAMSKFAQIPEDLFKQIPADVKMEGGGIARIQSGNEPMLEYSAFGENLSVFVLPANYLNKSPFKKVEHNGEDYFIGSCPKYHYVIWQCGGHECIGVSNLPEEKLASIAFTF